MDFNEEDYAAIVEKLRATGEYRADQLYELAKAKGFIDAAIEPMIKSGGRAA